MSILGQKYPRYVWANYDYLLDYPGIKLGGQKGMGLSVHGYLSYKKRDQDKQTGMLHIHM
ncbi:hypothetical protein GCM10027085_37600 [Spirosoma aerophilum]